MENKDSIDEDIKNSPSLKVYTLLEILFVTYLGGPAAGCYLMSVNFKDFNNKVLAKQVLVIGILASIVMFTALVFIPTGIADKIPNKFIPIIYTSIIGGFATTLQGKSIKDHVERGGKGYSWWQVIGI